MKLQAGRAPRAMLEQLACGPLKEKLFIARCKRIAPGASARNMNILRLQDGGLMVKIVEYRLTEAGRLALEKSR